jgi:hypothetical protein
MYTHIPIQPTPTLPDIWPPPPDVPGNLWAEIPYYTVYRFNPTLDILPQIAVNKQWRYVEVGQLTFLAVDVHLLNKCVRMFLAHHQNDCAE